MFGIFAGNVYKAKDRYSDQPPCTEETRWNAHGKLYIHNQLFLYNSSKAVEMIKTNPADKPSHEHDRA